MKATLFGRSLALVGGLLVTCLAGSAVAQDDPAPPPTRTDWLTFASGTIPIAVNESAQSIGSGFEAAVDVIDGNPGAGVIHRRFAEADTVFEFTYELPAATVFSEFVVPGIGETPSPSQTFIRNVEVLGAQTGDGPWTLLGSAVLAERPEGEDSVTFFALESVPVRYVLLRLKDPIEEGAVFLEFSEIIGYGEQEPTEMVDHFSGIWDPREGQVELQQDGPSV
ncbi:MAG: hypothetical protein KC561_19420, partial [Myxococcales bacterium]|nr:hypothetical protein [Myxococcales bacterium]